MVMKQLGRKRNRFFLVICFCKTLEPFRTILKIYKFIWGSGSTRCLHFCLNFEFQKGRRISRRKDGAQVRTDIFGQKMPRPKKMYCSPFFPKQSKILKISVTLFSKKLMSFLCIFSQFKSIGMNRNVLLHVKTRSLRCLISCLLLSRKFNFFKVIERFQKKSKRKKEERDLIEEVNFSNCKGLVRPSFFDKFKDSEMAEGRRAYRKTTQKTLKNWGGRRWLE